jgi:N-methylhydantoinase B
MAERSTDEFRRNAVRIAISSGLTRPQVSSDLGVGLSTLNKWVQQHQHDDLMSGPHEDFEKENTRLLKEVRLHLDFSGTSGRSAKGVNVPLNYATAYSVFAMRCTIGPDIPNNAGSLEPFVVTGPTNCILNAQRPVPVAMRHTLGQMTPDLVLGCLHQALPHMVPAEGSSCMYDLPMRHTADAVMR